MSQYLVKYVVLSLIENMGISRNHLHAVLQRADHSKSGTITYEQFLETVSSYRLNTEQASKIKQIGTALAYAEEFTCTPPKLFIAIGKVSCYSLNPNPIYLRQHNIKK